MKLFKLLPVVFGVLALCRVSHSADAVSRETYLEVLKKIAPGASSSPEYASLTTEELRERLTARTLLMSNGLNGLELSKYEVQAKEDLIYGKRFRSTLEQRKSADARFDKKVGGSLTSEEMRLTVETLKDLYLKLPIGSQSALAQQIEDILKSLMTNKEYKAFMELAKKRAAPQREDDPPPPSMHDHHPEQPRR